MLVLIREFDAAGAWSGFASCAVWLSWRTGLEPGAAREHVRVAHALAQLPKVSDAMRRGRVSYSKVRAITRVATPETEQSLLDVALAGTAAHVERVVRAWRRVGRAAEANDDRAQQAGQTLHTWVDDDGMVVVRGRLTPEAGSVFRRALEATVTADGGPTGVAGCGKERTTDPVDEVVGVERSHGQRQADALGRLAECALAGGLDRGTAGDRYQVVLHVDAETLAEDGAPDAQEHAADGDDPHSGVPAGTPLQAAPPSGAVAESEHAGAGAGNPDAEGDDAHRDVPAGTRAPVRRIAASCPGPRAGRRQAALAEDGGIRVGQETARRIACDAATVTMRHGADGGRARRRPQDADHLTRAAAGAGLAGRAVPLPGLRGPALRRAPRSALGRRRRDGARKPRAPVPAAPPGRARRRLPGAGGRRRRGDLPASRRAAAAGGAGGPELDGPALAPVVRRLAAAGIGIDADTAPRWQGERLDLGWAIDVLWRPRSGRCGPDDDVPAGTPGP